MPRSRYKPTTSGPRFPRGLALALIVGLLVPPVFSGLRKLAGGNVPAPVAVPGVVKSESALLAAGKPLAVAKRELSPHERYWKNAFAEIEGQRDDERREEIQANLAAQIPLSEIPSTLEELRQMGYGESDIFQRLVRRWAQADGRAAAAWAEQLPVGSLRESTLSAVAIEWANTDLNSIVAWSRQLPDAGEQRTLLIAAANEAVRSDPMASLRVAVTLTADGGRDETIRRAATEWASQDAASAVDWAKQIPDEALRSKVLAAEAVAWAESAPESAATLAVETLPPGRLLDDTVVSIVQRWAQQQPEAAAAWVEQFPEGELKVAATDNLLAIVNLQGQPAAEPGRSNPDSVN